MYLGGTSAFMIAELTWPILYFFQVILALLISYAVASFIRHDGDKYIDPTDIQNSSNG